MNIVKFVEENKIRLSNFQMDLLEILQVNPEGWIHTIKPYSGETEQVLRIYREWKETMLVAV